jgi:hypothetical protein
MRDLIRHPDVFEITGFSFDFAQDGEPACSELVDLSSHGFRRNDGKWKIQTFYERIKFRLKSL